MGEYGRHLVLYLPVRSMDRGECLPKPQRKRLMKSEDASTLEGALKNQPEKSSRGEPMVLQR